MAKGGERVLDDDELPYVRPKDWVELVERLRFDVGTGKRRIAGRTIKGVAFRLAWHADFTYGTGVYPGLARTAVGCEVDYDTAKKVFAVLRDLRLLTLVKAGRGPQGRRADVSDEYRLTIPEDLLDRGQVRVLDPNEFRKEVAALRDVKRGRLKTPEVAGVRPLCNLVVDNSPEARLQGCIPSATEQPVEKVAEGMHPADSELRRGCTPSCGGDAPLPTSKEQALTANEHSLVPAQPRLTRARGRANTLKPQPTIDRCDHGIAIGIRDDGTPTCALCRRSQPAGDVIPLHRDRSVS